MNVLFASLGFLEPLASRLYIADFFDVFIIALFLYAGLLLFKQTRSFSILIGISITVILYGVASFFNLYLTSTLLQSFFSVFLVVLVIIFQEELRRFFELVALVGTRQTKRAKAQSSPSEISGLLQAIANLSFHKVGALIVFAGNENIERHTEGGIVLDAVISQELLESIFDPTSPGHDGAIIINQNRVATLGAHLPLSNDFKQIGKHGTRHCAALGIAERSDAFAIVVSEERGTISIARNGELTGVPNTEKLETLLKAFLKEKFPRNSTSFFENFIKKNTTEKLIAIGISGLLWFFVSYQAGSVQRDFILPISYRNLPADLVIEDARPKTLTVTLESRGRAFEQLDPKTLELSVDASTLASGEEIIHVNDSMVKRPLNFSVVNVTPSAIQLSLSRYTAATAPITISTINRLPAKYVLDSISTSPAFAQILVSEKTSAPSELNTTPIDLSQITSNQNILATLILPKGIRLADDSPSNIVVTIIIHQR